ncbi:hypothetical protein CLOM_g2483 [Closterium sp. NIES-68]|nr:hypothetical protein CLOM_g2483 [Closterium sp. NIES-68]GJP74325.1 hypothetical protein CLOP_g4922 [Closterium sp. NIES-67]
MSCITSTAANTRHAAAGVGECERQCFQLRFHSDSDMRLGPRSPRDHAPERRAGRLPPALCFPADPFPAHSSSAKPSPRAAHIRPAREHVQFRETTANDERTSPPCGGKSPMAGRAAVTHWPQTSSNSPFDSSPFDECAAARERGDSEVHRARSIRRNARPSFDTTAASGMMHRSNSSSSSGSSGSGSSSSSSGGGRNDGNSHRRRSSFGEEYRPRGNQSSSGGIDPVLTSSWSGSSARMRLSRSMADLATMGTTPERDDIEAAEKLALISPRFLRPAVSRTSQGKAVRNAGGGGGSNGNNICRRSSFSEDCGPRSKKSSNGGCNPVSTSSWPGSSARMRLSRSMADLATMGTIAEAPEDIHLRNERRSSGGGDVLLPLHESPQRQRNAMQPTTAAMQPTTGAMRTTNGSGRGQDGVNRTSYPQTQGVFDKISDFSGEPSPHGRRRRGTDFATQVRRPREVCDAVERGLVSTPADYPASTYHAITPRARHRRSVSWSLAPAPAAPVPTTTSTGTNATSATNATGATTGATGASCATGATGATGAPSAPCVETLATPRQRVQAQQRPASHADPTGLQRASSEIRYETESLVQGGGMRMARMAGCLDALISFKSAQMDSVRRERAELSAELEEGVRRVRDMEAGMAERRLAIESLVVRISEKLRWKRELYVGDGQWTEEDALGDDDKDGTRSKFVGHGGDGSSADDLRDMLQLEMHAIMADVKRVELAALHAQYRSGEIRRDLRRKSAELASIGEARELLVRRKDALAQQALPLV